MASGRSDHVTSDHVSYRGRHVAAERAMDVAALAVGIVVVCLVLWLWRRHQNFQYFKSLGVPGPPPSFWYGNLKELITKGPIDAHRDWSKAHGPFYGIFLGVFPTFVTTDRELIKRITITDFRNFTNRTGFIAFLGTVLFDAVFDSMGLKSNQEWKESRRILTHTFTPVQLKQMPQIVSPAIEKFLDAIRGRVKDLGSACYELCLDLLLRSTLGLAGGHEPLKQGLKVANDHSFYSTWHVRTIFYFPELSSLFEAVFRLKERIQHLLGLPTGYEPVLVAQRVLAERIANPREAGFRKDMIQLMLDSRSSESGKRALTDSEIVANIVDFMLGGMDSMGITLTAALFHLAKDEDVQERCRQEALACPDLNSYEELAKLRLLEGAINEALRLNSTGGIVINRVAEEEFHHGEWRIPKGSSVLMPNNAIHMDPERWLDPERFDPERSVDVKEDFLGFGVGPRSCLANRFAPMLLKQCLGRVLSKYRLRAPADAPQRLKVEYGMFSLKLLDPAEIETTPL